MADQHCSPHSGKALQEKRQVKLKLHVVCYVTLYITPYLSFYTERNVVVFLNILFIVFFQICEQTTKKYTKQLKVSPQTNIECCNKHIYTYTHIHK